MRATIATLLFIGCLGAARLRFVAAQSPLPPPPASNLRVVPETDRGWRLEWQDNSGGSARYEGGIVVVNPRGERVAVIDFGRIPADRDYVSIPVGAPSGVESTCYGGIVFLFALAADGATTWPANTAVPICFKEGRVAFPETGFAGHNRPSAPLWQALALAVGGVLFAIAGSVLRRRGP